MKLTELIQKDEMLQTYEIYKHCMFMPTEEKFHKKVDRFLEDSSIKFLACFDQGKRVGVMAVSFMEPMKIEIMGIAVDVAARGKGVGSYMISQAVNDYDLLSVYAETDKDAVGFYRNNGFRIGEIYETYGDETVIRYQCELTMESNSNRSIC